VQAREQVFFSATSGSSVLLQLLLVVVWQHRRLWITRTRWWWFWSTGTRSGGWCYPAPSSGGGLFAPLPQPVVDYLVVAVLALITCTGSLPRRTLWSPAAGEGGDCLSTSLLEEDSWRPTQPVVDYSVLLPQLVVVRMEHSTIWSAATNSSMQH
jgi:hypothetical protein